MHQTGEPLGLVSSKMDAMEITYRLARVEDVPALRELIDASVRSLSVGYYTEAQAEAALVHVFGVDTQLIEDGTYFLASDGAQIVGAGGWSKRMTLYGGDQTKGEADPLLDPGKDAARIRAFFVHPGWARRGIGRRLIEMCEEAAIGAGFGRMELASTMPGEPLYAALGYKVVERSEIPMPGGDVLAIARMEKVVT